MYTTKIRKLEAIIENLEDQLQASNDKNTEMIREKVRTRNEATAKSNNAAAATATHHLLT